MNVFESIYAQKDNPKIVSRFLEMFLSCEIYSPLIIRQASERWSELPFYIKEGMHPEIYRIIKNSHDFSKEELSHKINAHAISRAIKVLTAYSNCSIPITQDPSISTFKQNLLSKRGQWALKRLLYALCHQELTPNMTELALKTSHKFLMDDGFYIKWPSLDKFDQSPEILLTPVENGYAFPILQLSSGCQNNCSHCFADAKPHLQHMPYPMFRALYLGLDKWYRYCEGEKYFTIRDENGQEKIPLFDRFYHDSDCAQYCDPIMGVDAGDVVRFVNSNGGNFYFQTKGITNKTSRRAIAKACQDTPIHLSFVDTPKENMHHNIQQLQNTIRLIESIPKHEEITIDHLVLKNGPSVSNDVFLGYTPQRLPIFPSGRANQFSKRLLDEYENVLFPMVIKPNGQFVQPVVEKGKYHSYKLNSFFHQNRPKKME